nr:putative transposase (putative), gypsy type [Tanacetum cinerariifolium]
MGRDTVQLETAVNTISHEYLLEFTSEYGVPETLHPELPGPEDRIVDFPEGKVGVYTRFFEFANFCFPLSQFLFDVLDMDLYNLIRAPNSTKVKTGSRPRAPHELPLLTLTATRVIEMDEPAAAIDSSGVPSIIERSPLDFAHEAGASDQGTAAPEMPPSKDVPATAVPGAGQAEETAATDPPAASESRKRGRDGTDVNAPQSHCGGIMLILDPQGAPMGKKIRYPLLTLHHVIPSMLPRDSESENAFSAAEVGSPESVYRPEWGVTNGSLLDTPEACQDPVDHVAPPGYFSVLRHMHNEEFLRQYNVNLARQVAMGSQLRLRFEQEAKLLRKSVAQTAEDRSAGLSQELENMRAQFSGLQVSNERLSQQVATLQQQVSREEKLKGAFEEFKRQQDERAFADAISAGIAKGLSEGLRHGLEHGQAQLSFESIEAYDPEVEAKFVVALQALKDLKYPLVDQLESLKDAPMDVIMAALYLESDTGDDA